MNYILLQSTSSGLVPNESTPYRLKSRGVQFIAFLIPQGTSHVGNRFVIRWQGYMINIMRDVWTKYYGFIEEGVSVPSLRVRGGFLWYLSTYIKELEIVRPGWSSGCVGQVLWDKPGNKAGRYVSANAFYPSVSLPCVQWLLSTRNLRQQTTNIYSVKSPCDPCISVSLVQITQCQ